MKIYKEKNVQIPDDYTCSITDMGNIIEVSYVRNKSYNDMPIRKISKEYFVYKDTGEVGEYNSVVRSDNYESLRHTFKRMRKLINNNFVGEKNELHIILTYRENMTDVKRLYDDFRKFWQRFKYKYGDAENVTVAEPQQRGAWHCHVLVRIDGKESVYIDNNELCVLWGHGFTKVKSLAGNDNIGVYLSAYLGDLMVDDDYNTQTGDVIEYKEIDGQTKRVLKGARLKYYPSGMNIYRSSRGIKKPDTYMDDYGDVNEIKELKCTHSCKYEVKDESGKNVNTIIHMQYNKKRKFGN